MKKTRRIVISILTYIAITGCTTKTEYEDASLISEFPEPIVLEGEKIETEKYGLYQPYYLEFIDSILVMSTFSGDTLIGVYDRKGSFKASFGSMGQGPNELNDRAVIYDYEIDANKGITVTTFDDNLLTLDRINLTQSIADAHFVIEETYEFPGETRRISSAFYLDSTKIVGIYEGQFYKNLDQRTGLYDFDPQAKSFETFRLPNIDFDPSDSTSFTFGHYITRLNARYSDISLTNNHVAIIMRHIPLLQIFKIEGRSFEKTGSYYLDEAMSNHVYKMELFENGQYPNYYSDVTVSDRYIYLLKNANRAIDEEPMEAHIQVLDWQGAPQAVYTIPSNFDIHGITVNETDSIIFGLSFAHNGAMYKFHYGK